MTDEPYAETRVERWEQRTRWMLTTLAAGFLVAYAIPILWPGVPGYVKGITAGFDICVWLLFAADYVVRLVLAKDRFMFVRRNLIDLLIVIIPPARPLRLLRVVIVLVEAITRQAGVRARARLAVFVSGTTLLMVFVSSLAVLDAERGAPDAKILTYFDALWWSVVTVTTVGYGDYFPVTTSGRVIAVTLMLTGIGLIGFVTGSLASWVVDKVAAEDKESAVETQADIAVVLAEVRALRAEVSEMREGRAAQVDSSQPGV